MNKLTHKFSSELIPQLALIVYHDNKNEKIYLERRNIYKSRMMAGTPLTEECINKIAELTLNVSRKELHGIIPSNMLYSDSRKGYEKYVWYEKAQKKMHYYSSKLGIPSGELFTPSLLYVAQGNALSIYAFNGDTINLNTKLYRAPYFNVSDTSVCLGNSHLPEIQELTYNNIIEYWEKMFWLSEFDHILGGNPIKSNLSILSKKLMQTGKPFPKSELIPVNKTLKNILQ